MIFRKPQERFSQMVPAVIAILVFCFSASELVAQVRTGRRSTTTRATTTTTSSATRSRGTAVQGDEGAAVVGRHGAAVKGDEGYAAVGRHGAVVKGEEGAAAAGRRGAVVAGEEGFGAAGHYGGAVVGSRYEDYEAWRAIAGAGAAIAVGTMLARPPAAATTVVVGGTTYWRYQNTYYARAYSGGSVVYQVVPAPQ